MDGVAITLALLTVAGAIRDAGVRIADAIARKRQKEGGSNG